MLLSDDFASNILLTVCILIMTIFVITASTNNRNIDSFTIITISCRSTNSSNLYGNCSYDTMVHVILPNSPLSCIYSKQIIHTAYESKWNYLLLFLQ